MILLLILMLGLLVYVSPIILGIMIIGVINGISKAGRGKYAPVLWDILTVLVTFRSTRMLWMDIGSDLIDTGFQPFTTLLTYGVISLVFIGILSLLNQNEAYVKSILKINRIETINVNHRRK